MALSPVCVLLLVAGVVLGEGGVTTTEKRIADLETENQVLKDWMEEVLIRMEELQQMVLEKLTDKEHKDSYHENKFNKQDSKINEQDSKISQLENDMSNMYNDKCTNCNSHSLMNTIVSFTAYVSVGQLDVDSRFSIIFDKTVINRGDHYSIATGVFTCPETGYYLFSATLHSYGSSTENFIAEIQLANTALVALDQASGTSTNAHTSIVISCEQSQQVSVRSLLDTSNVYGTETLRLSTFSGTLLFVA